MYLHIKINFLGQGFHKFRARMGQTHTHRRT